MLLPVPTRAPTLSLRAMQRLNMHLYRNEQDIGRVFVESRGRGYEVGEAETQTEPGEGGRARLKWRSVAGAGLTPFISPLIPARAGDLVAEPKCFAQRQTYFPRTSNMSFTKFDP